MTLVMIPPSKGCQNKAVDLYPQHGGSVSNMRKRGPYLGVSRWEEYICERAMRGAASGGHTRGP